MYVDTHIYEYAQRQTDKHTFIHAHAHAHTHTHIHTVAYLEVATNQGTHDQWA